MNLSGCVSPVDTQHISFVVDDSLRNRSAIMIDIVCVTNPVLAAQLEELYPSGYFPHVDDLVTRYNGQVKVWRFVVSNQKKVYNLVLHDLPSHEYFQLFFFCAYPIQGRFCGKITNLNQAVISLYQHKITIENKERQEYESTIDHKNLITLFPKRKDEFLSFYYRLSDDYIDNKAVGHQVKK